MTLPTIHSNGTSVQTLIDGYDAIDEALYRLTLKWGEVEFNPRDYYPQGPEAWEDALNERQKHAGNLKALQDYLNAIRNHLYDHLP